MSFHDVQQVILKYRADRIENFKLVFPKLGVSGASDDSNDPATHGNNNRTTRTRIVKKKRGKVSEAVAPATMFLHMKGSNNADIISTVIIYAFIFSARFSNYYLFSRLINT